jgi:hypothetical protein
VRIKCVVYAKEEKKEMTKKFGREGDKCLETDAREIRTWNEVSGRQWDRSDGRQTWKKMIPQATTKRIQKTSTTPGLCAAQLSAI